MNAMHIIAVVFSVFLTILGLLSLLSFFYCLYLGGKGAQLPSSNNVGNTTVTTEKSVTYSRPSTRTHADKNQQNGDRFEYLGGSGWEETLKMDRAIEQQAL